MSERTKVVGAFPVSGDCGLPVVAVMVWDNGNIQKKCEGSFNPNNQTCVSCSCKIERHNK
ncbi:MAG: hypothetical protein WC528_00055 [Patescibacteria group bacterium]